ncbi:MAG: hypothetical protein H0W88_01440 [Parachlamydiaceae bacterium]|nr:hypothetical protein [Parachlamydiaceae bacterium]
MQIYALDESDKIVIAKTAKKHQDYYCTECRNRLRLRGGNHRQNHFFHIEPNRHCRLHGKGMVHIQVQQHLLELLPINECQLEYRFPQIKRIADVAWIQQKVIFEIQCSPITAEEIRNRNRDYQLLGWQVIWILHDKRYNQWRLSSAELALRNSPHYFTNMDSEGVGIIYDQFDLISYGIRKHKLKALQIDPTYFHILHPSISNRRGIKLIEHRLKHWSVHFRGDLIDVHDRREEEEYIHAAKELEKNWNKSDVLVEKRSFVFSNYFKNIIYNWVLRPYKLLFQIILERMCR